MTLETILTLILAVNGAIGGIATTLLAGIKKAQSGTGEALADVATNVGTLHTTVLMNHKVVDAQRERLIEAVSGNPQRGAAPVAVPAPPGTSIQPDAGA
jgi:hypothetical protein